MSTRRNQDLIALIQELQARVTKLEQGITNGRLTLSEVTLFDARTGRKITLTVGRDAFTTPGGNSYPAVGIDNSIVVYNLNTGLTTVIPIV